MATVADDIGGGFDLNPSVIVNRLGSEVILMTAETPIAEVVFVQVLASFPQFFDDDFIEHAVFDHAVYLLAEFGGQARNFAVATGVGLASLELAGEIVLQRIGVMKKWSHEVRDT